MVNTIIGYLFDGWNSLRFAVKECGEAVDRALDCWDDNE